VSVTDVQYGFVVVVMLDAVGLLHRNYNVIPRQCKAIYIYLWTKAKTNFPPAFLCLAPRPHRLTFSLEIPWCCPSRDSRIGKSDR
jgi:hypothetical protein